MILLRVFRGIVFYLAAGILLASCRLPGLGQVPAGATATSDVILTVSAAPEATLLPGEYPGPATQPGTYPGAPTLGPQEFPLSTPAYPGAAETHLPLPPTLTGETPGASPPPYPGVEQPQATLDLADTVITPNTTDLPDSPTATFPPAAGQQGAATMTPGKPVEEPSLTLTLSPAAQQTAALTVEAAAQISSTPPPGLSQGTATSPVSAQASQEAAPTQAEAPTDAPAEIPVGPQLGATGLATTSPSPTPMPGTPQARVTETPTSTPAPRTTAVTPAPSPAYPPPGGQNISPTALTPTEPISPAATPLLMTETPERAATEIQGVTQPPPATAMPPPVFEPTKPNPGQFSMQSSGGPAPLPTAAAPVANPPAPLLTPQTPGLTPTGPATPVSGPAQPVSQVGFLSGQYNMQSSGLPAANALPVVTPVPSAEITPMPGETATPPLSETAAPEASPTLEAPTTTPSPPTSTPYMTPTPTITSTPTVTPTPLPAPPWVYTRLPAADPRTVVLASGKPQLIMFFAYWNGPSQAMSPVIQGLEGEYKGRVIFTYLDIDDPGSGDLQRKLGFRMEPHIFLLDAAGQVVYQWTGSVGLETLRRALDEVSR